MSAGKIEACTQWLRHPFGWGVFPLTPELAAAKRKKDAEVATVRYALAHGITRVA